MAVFGRKFIGMFAHWKETAVHAHEASSSSHQPHHGVWLNTLLLKVKMSFGNERESRSHNTQIIRNTWRRRPPRTQKHDDLRPSQTGKENINAVWVVTGRKREGRGWGESLWDEEWRKKGKKERRKKKKKDDIQHTSYGNGMKWNALPSSSSVSFPKAPLPPPLLLLPR